MFDSLETRRCRDIEGIVSPERRPEKFRDFRETGPGEDLMYAP